MSEPNEPKPKLPLTTRQIRIRYLTVIILCVILVMIVVGLTHPFFSLTPPAALTDHIHDQDSAILKPIRRAFAAKLMVIGGYWAVCIALTLLLPILAWIYSRDIQLQELMARRDIWRDITDRNRDKTQDNASEESADSSDDQHASNS